MHPNFYFLLKFFKICHSEHGVLLVRVQGVTLFTSDSECVNRRGARSVRNSQTQKKEKWSMPGGRAAIRPWRDSFPIILRARILFRPDPSKNPTRMKNEAADDQSPYHRR
jgi:hypothetical protein